MQGRDETCIWVRKGKVWIVCRDYVRTRLGLLRKVKCTKNSILLLLLFKVSTGPRCQVWLRLKNN